MNVSEVGAKQSRLWAMALVAVFVGMLSPSAEAADPARIGLAISRTGSNADVDRWVLEGAQLAVEEANVEKGASSVELSVTDDLSTTDGAIAAARKIIAGNELIVVGPGLTTSSVAVGPIYAEAGLVSLVPTVHGDTVTDAKTTFRPLFSTSEMGMAIADYVRYIQNGKRAVVIFTDTGYGQPIAAGFKKAADKLGIEATTIGYKNADEAQKAAQQVLAMPDKPTIVLAALFAEAKPILATLRRGNAPGPILGVSTMAGDDFAALFANEPEEKQKRGFFTDGVLAASPLMLDSAGADAVAFAERFRKKFGRDPIWRAVQAYDATKLAVAAARSGAGASDLKARREAARAYVAGIDGPAKAIKGAAGPLWFTPERGRQQAVRFGTFNGGLFESAPLQLVPLANKPSAERIASGAAVELGSGQYARRQQIVYAGVYINTVPRVDVAPATFTADFYLWMRFNRNAGAGAAEPTEIEFPDLVRGTFDPKKTANEAELPDGTLYRLWRVRGDFKNDYDLRRFPSDRQHLIARFFNARAASDALIYARDLRTLGPAGDGSISAPGAFRELAQWEVEHVGQGRDILATASSLGDTRVQGAEGRRELSGFNLTVDIHRRVMSTVSKSLLPLGLLILMLFVTLYIPLGNIGPRVAIVITGTLTASVLLSATNAQLGNVGYPIAVEQVFYIFFFLCLVCLVGVIMSERLRGQNKLPQALKVETGARAVFVAVVAVAAAVAVYMEMAS